ncbi:MAG: TonB-dependent receptor [Sphingobacteriales bacterium]|nr:MAG: TonB-dependent receptor [Sphingobacteriales bacterium]
MGYRIISLLLVFISISINTAFAGQANITGRVKDEGGKALETANIVLLQAGTNKLVQAALTTENGSFVLEGIADGRYLLKATLLAHQDFSSDTLTVQGADITLPDITLKAKGTALKEVAIRAQKPFIEVQPDKLVVNVENSIVSTGLSALEILSRSPGVRVDQNDNILLKGRQGVRVMIDGKLTPMAGTDLANVLKSMPSNSIDRIEIISNPGARYDAAGTGGIINIRMKKDQRLGMNGSVNASYAQGVYPKANAGINLNYRNKKLNVYGNYNYAHRYWFNHLMLDRRFYTNNNDVLLSSYVQDNFSLFDFNNHIGSGGIDYSLSDKTTVGLSGTVGSNRFNPRADNRSRALDGNNNLIYFFNTTGRHKNRYYNYSLNGNLRHRFDSTGRELSIDLDYAAYGNQSNQNFITTYTAASGAEYQAPYYMNSDLSGYTQIRSAKADYTHPLKGNARLDAGAKLTYVTADNEPLFYELLNGINTLDITRSNHFVYSENVNAAYVNLNKSWDKWGTQLGLRAENTNVKGEQITLNTSFTRDYTQLFPSLAVQRHLDKQNDLGLTLSRRIERPDYQQLNPFKFFIDKTTYREGYPYLLPSTAYSVELAHTFKQRFITTFTYSITNNPIVEVIQPSDNDTGKVTVQTNKNLARMSYYSISGSYNFQVTKWWNNTTNYNAYYARYEGFVANTRLDKGAPTFDININNSFILPKDFSAEIGGFYQARQVYGFMTVNPVWMLNAGLQKNFWDKKATLRLNAQDIFWKGFPSATSTYSGYQEDFIAERETRQVTLAFTYRFGKRTVAPARRRSGGAEDEKRRAGNA